MNLIMVCVHIYITTVSEKHLHILKTRFSEDLSPRDVRFLRPKRRLEMNNNNSDADNNNNGESDDSDIQPRKRRKLMKHSNKNNNNKNCSSSDSDAEDQKIDCIQIK